MCVRVCVYYIYSIVGAINACCTKSKQKRARAHGKERKKEIKEYKIKKSERRAGCTIYFTKCNFIALSYISETQACLIGVG